MIQFETSKSAEASEILPHLFRLFFSLPSLKLASISSPLHLDSFLNLSQSLYVSCTLLRRFLVLRDWRRAQGPLHSFLASFHDHLDSKSQWANLLLLKVGPDLLHHSPENWADWFNVLLAASKKQTKSSWVFLFPDYPPFPSPTPSLSSLLSRGHHGTGTEKREEKGMKTDGKLSLSTTETTKGPLKWNSGVLSRSVALKKSKKNNLTW